MKVFDTHCHLAGDELLPRAVELVKEGLDAGVMGFAIISADAPSLKTAPQLSAEIKALYANAQVGFTAGIHPHEAKEFEPDNTLWQQVEDLASSAIAIGETGLDFYYNHSDASIQHEIFGRHIELASRTRKPLVIHCRNAIEAILKDLDREEIKNHPNPGVLHCFSEDWDSAKTLLDRNFYISFSGIITFKNADRLREVVKKMPLDRILVETDSPWLAPAPYRGQRNQPAYVTEVLKMVQSLRPEDKLEVEDTIYNNSLKFFGFHA